ncbi:MAG: SpoIIE family protein phosphatase [Actinomycetota bacterium]|nr:SpoIIE family protein phosphatase [Actinomycetota bacterium]
MVKEISHPKVPEESRIEALEQTLESLREDSEVAHVLLGLSAALAEVRTVEETLEKSVRLVPELCAADRCFAVSRDEMNNRFALMAQVGYDDNAAAVLESLAAAEDGFPLVAESLKTATPLLVDDVANDDRISPEHVGLRRLGALISLPLSRWGDEFGALVIEFAQPKQFGPKDAALARGIARQVGIALANARRFGLLRDLRTFGLRVGSRLSLSDVVEDTAAGAVDLLAADGALIYFLDAQAGTMVASEGRGLSEAHIEQLKYLDLDSGPWAPALEGQTVVIEDFDEATKLDTGLNTAVLLPLSGEEKSLMGALAVFFARRAILGPDEIEGFNVLGAQAATAIANAQRFERQRRVARSLQSGLMSTEMPALPGCSIGAVYEPASSQADVGGDFFDVFELNDGKVAVVVGDVSGKGAEAAAQTAMAKYMLRAFAIRNAVPASVLFHLNNALVKGFPEDRFTTALYAVLDPATHSIQLANGGHPPALVYRVATGEVEILESDGGLIGAFEDEQYGSNTIHLDPGDVLLAFTDGLTEVRNENDLYGRHRIVESLKKHAVVSDAEELSRRIYREAASFGTVWDDTVVLALACKPS